MTRLFTFSLAALTLSACFTDPQTTTRAAQPDTAQDSGLVVLDGNASEAQLTRAAQNIKTQHGEFLVVPMIVTNQSGDAVAHRNYVAACDRQQVDRVIGQIAADGQRYGRTLRGPASTAKNAYDTLVTSRRAYEAAQRRCGFDYRREIAQLKSREASAWNTYTRASAPRQSNFSIGDATALITGATAILGALNPGGGGGSVYGDCPPTHQVCK